jgi:hypothetical protein
MNELPATVTGQDRVDVAGVTVAAPAAGRFSIDQDVLLLVRPEDVEVTPLVPANGGGADGQGLTGTVSGQTFAGAATLVHVRVDRLDLLLSAHGTSTRASELVAGTRVAVKVDGARALCEVPEAVPAVEVEA